MMQRAATLLSLLTLLFASSMPARADDALDLLSKYLAWRGGARFEALQTVHERGQVRLGEVEGSFERWLGRDGRLRQNRSLGPLEDSEAVTANSNWTTNASGQLEELGDHGQEDRRAIALAFADLGRLHAGMSYQSLGTEQYDGRPWAVVRVGFGGNDSYDLFLDAASGELLGERITQDRATRFVHYGDWRMVSGIRMAFEQRVTSSNPGADETRRLASIEVNSTLAASLFAPPVPKRSWSFSAGRSSTGWIPFEFYNNDQIFIPATVNGRATSFVLDSGADITILDKATASTIGAKLSGAVPVGGTGGQATMQLAPHVEVQIGALELHGITAGVMDLSGMASQLGHPLPMILGKEVFNQLIVDIDFPNRRIAFHERAHLAVPPGAVRVALGRHGENRTVPVSVEGRAAVDFDFDLGSNSPVIIYPFYRDSVQLLAGRRQSRELSAGVGGMFRPVCATLKAIAIGGLSLPDVPADFPDPADSALNSDRMGGNIGLPVFSRFRLLTDYAQNAIWLVADPNAVAQPFPRNRAGVIALPAGDRLKVLMIAPRSPAEQGAWKEGTEIVAIDGHRIDASYRNSPLSRWATQAAGTHVVLTLADGSTKEIVLADYF
jgi:hypothetical protein